MAISFEESLKQAAAAQVKNTVTDALVAPMAETYGVATLALEGEDLNSTGLIAAYSGEESWERSTKYRYIPDFSREGYSDENYTVIGEDKEIRLNEKQFNITQESYSQYIPFEMYRYYDGIDLLSAELSVHFTTKSGHHEGHAPVNVFYTNDKIRFGWMVPEGATIDAGTLDFFIMATGFLHDDENNLIPYVWKTQTNKTLTVLESTCVCDDQYNKLDPTWIENLVTSIAEGVAEEVKNIEIGAQVEAAEEAANRAEAAASNAETTATAVVSQILADGKYVDENYVTKKISEIPTPDVSGQIKTHNEAADAHSDIRQLISGIQIPTKVSELTNDSGFLTNIPDDYVTESELTNKGYLTSIPDEYVTGTELETSLNGYATTNYVDDKAKSINDSVKANTSSIAVLQETLDELKNASPDEENASAVYYRVTYGDIEAADGSTQEDILTLLEYDSDPAIDIAAKGVAVSQIKIVGGSSTGNVKSDDINISYKKIDADNYMSGA